MHKSGPTLAARPYQRGAEAEDEEPAGGGRGAAGALPPAAACPVGIAAAPAGVDGANG